MTLQEVREEFIREYFGGSTKQYRKARKDDYCKAQYEWSCFIDCLCRDGLITQKQYDKATF